MTQQGNSFRWDVPFEDDYIHERFKEHAGLARRPL